jgi:hypothetical protein
MTDAQQASIDLLTGGGVAPLTQFNVAQAGQPGVFDGGVYDATGAVSITGIQWKGGYRNEPVTHGSISAWIEEPGCHVFGGMMQNRHFGHFMAESLSRLWALKTLGRDFRSVVFYLRTPEKPMPPWAIDTISFIAPEVQVRAIAAPTRFEVLAVPAQLAYRGTGYIYGHSMVRRSMAPLRQFRAGGAKRVYVSRSQLAAADGGFLLETVLEQNLAAEGYRIIHPQKLPVREQLEAYNDASDLIFADGSAIHLYALVAREDQRVFNIWRRKPGGGFADQIRSFGGQRVQGKPCIRSLWMPPVGFGAATKMKAALDFAVLRDQLVTCDFITGRGWTVPTAADFERDLERLQTVTRVEYREQRTPELLT